MPNPRSQPLTIGEFVERCSSASNELRDPAVESSFDAIVADIEGHD